jgi:ubiquinone/menaquinone biosynthesis C-methylase UbiE
MKFLNYSTIIDPWLKDIRIFLLTVAGIKRGDNVLDVCCGTGDQVFYYAQEPVSAFGVDFNPNMIKIAQEDKRNKDANNVFFRIGDANNLPFGDGFFDCVSISLALHEMEQPVRDKVISEMKRVVKKGGKLVFADFQTPLPGGFYSRLINSAEYLAGNNNFKRFKDYIAKGGLPGLMKDNKIKPDEVSFIKEGNITIITGEA